MSLTYGTVLTEGYNWPQHSVGLVNVSLTHANPVSQWTDRLGRATTSAAQICLVILFPR